MQTRQEIETRALKELGWGKRQVLRSRTVDIRDALNSRGSAVPDQAVIPKKKGLPLKGSVCHNETEQRETDTLSGISPGDTQKTEKDVKTENTLSTTQLATSFAQEAFELKAAATPSDNKKANFKTNVATPTNSPASIPQSKVSRDAGSTSTVSDCSRAPLPPRPDIGSDPDLQALQSDVLAFSDAVHAYAKNNSRHLFLSPGNGYTADMSLFLDKLKQAASLTGRQKLHTLTERNHRMIEEAQCVSQALKSEADFLATNSEGLAEHNETLRQAKQLIERIDDKLKTLFAVRSDIEQIQALLQKA